jgi:hypothetical protein
MRRVPLRIAEKMRAYYAFVLAAAAAPLGVLATGPCGSGACGACAAGGACFVAFPLVIFGVLFVKSGRWMKQKIMGN